jgi:predicted RNA-binding Zn ribbon-like protein
MPTWSHPEPTASRIRASREDLCLNFANTLTWRGSAAPTDTLGGFPDLLAWLARSGQLPSPALFTVADWAQQHPRRAARLFAEAIALREAVFRCCFAVAARNAAPAADLEVLNHALAAAPPRRRLIRDDGVYAWATDGRTPPDSLLLAPILWSMADLLTRTDQLRVRCCANDKCLWLFIDRSKAGTRRWCDMAACGNRAKAQRHYRRQRSV